MEDNVYRCDICWKEKNIDEEIIWITSSYGVCKKCYQKLTEEELEKIRKEFE